MDFRILGSLEAWDGPRQIEIRGAKRRAVLALLVLHANEVVGKDRLIDELWGETAPRSAAASLHNHISRLRKVLGSDCLSTRAWGYVLRADPEQVDLQKFERLIRDAEALPANERSARLAEALSLWRGPALADLSFGPALMSEAARLEELRLGAVETRIDADLEIGRHGQVIGELEALIAEHPLRERLRGQLILALYRDGRQAEALEVYRETRRLLADELGLEPSPALRELERAILRQDPSLASTVQLQKPIDAEHVSSRWRWPRSPLVAVPVLLLLASAGVAVAIVAAASGGSHKTKAAPGSSTRRSTSTPNIGAAKPTTTQAERAVAKTRERQSSPNTRDAHRALITRRPHAAVARPARRSHVTQRIARRPSVPTITKSKRTKPSAVPSVYWLADDFGDPTVDYGRWNVASHGTGVQVVQGNGRLTFSILPDITTDGVYGVDQHYGTNCRLTGNFDARVEYKLLSWPAADGVYVTFGAWFPPIPGVFWSIARAGEPTSGGSEAYVSSIGSSTGSVQTGDMSGGLRIDRVNGVLTTYFRYRRSWMKLSSGYEPGPAGLVLMLGTTADQFGHRAASAAFAKFQATGTSVDCPPGTPLPPRRPRR